jgi:hypothetical protein
VRLPRLERLAVVRRGSLCGLAALRAALPALRVVELKRQCCGNYGCPVIGCTHRPDTVELRAELRAAWPGLELRGWEDGGWTQA